MARQPYSRGLIPDQSDSSLVGAWLNDAVSGAADYSSAGNDGTATAIVYESWGALFNGSTSKITLGSDPASTGNRTFSFWLNVTSLGTSGRIFDNGKLLIWTFAGNKIAVSNDAAVTVANSNAAWQFGEWHHIVVRRHSDGTVDIYVDSSLSGAAGQNAGTPAAATTAAVIGNRQDSTRPYDGLIASVGIYSEIKSADWIKTEFRKGVPDSSLVLSMQGDVTDESVYGLTFTPQADAIVGNGYKLDGTGDYLLNSTADWRSADSAGTIMAWIKRDAIGAFHDILTSADQAGVVGYMLFRVHSDNKLSLTQRNGAGDTATDVKSTNSLVSGIWYHVAATSNGTTIALYINGTAETTVGTNDGDWFGDTTARDNVCIGAWRGSSLVSQFNGIIDDVKVFSEAKSADYIWDYYSATRDK